MAKEYRTKNMEVRPSVLDNMWFWRVFRAPDNQTTELAANWTNTKAQAIRDARNFIKNNQNAVYA